MNQEMSEIPEYRQSKNAPSQNAIDEAYFKGKTEGIKEGLIIVIMAITEMIKLHDEQTNKNHHHGDE